MNLRTQLLAAIIVLGATITPIRAVLADEDSFLIEIGKFIGGALRGEAPDPAAARVAVEFMPAERDGAIPGEKDCEEFKERLQAYSDAMQSWIVQSCDLSEDQQARVKELLTAQLTTSNSKFAKTKNTDRQQQNFPATFPLLFTIRKSAIAPEFANAVTAELKKNVLTPEQIERLETALTDRENFQHQAYVTFVVSLIDKELFLTAGQRLAMTEKLNSLNPGIEHSLYTFQPQTYYMPYVALSTLLARSSVKDILEPSQKKRLTDLTGSDPNNQQIVFQASSGVDEWFRQMNQMGLKQREQFLRAAAVRVTWYEKELDLSSEQIEFLNNASKGAAIRALGDWKESTQQTFEHMEQQMAQMGGNFGFGASAIDTRAIEQNEIWADAVKTITEGTAKDRLEQRSATDRAAIAGAVLALFDDELWLLPKQRAAMMGLFETAMPKDANVVQYQEYIREVILMAHPLFRVTEKQRNEILDEPQRAVWTKLSAFFQWQKENNYVQIPLRNNGGSFGFMLGQ